MGKLLEGQILPILIKNKGTRYHKVHVQVFHYRYRYTGTGTRIGKWQAEEGMCPEYRIPLLKTFLAVVCINEEFKVP